MTSPPSCRSYRHSTPESRIPILNAYVYTDEYAGYDNDARDYRSASSETSRSPVIPPFSDQWLPPADSMLFGGGSAGSLLGSAARQSSDDPRTPSPRRSNRGLAASAYMYQYPTYNAAGVNSQRGVYNTQHEEEPPRWQTAPTPEYRHLELSEPYEESPQSCQYDDGFDFERTGPPPTPRHTGLPLRESHNRTKVPLDRNHYYGDSRFLSPSQGRGLRQHRTLQSSRRAMPTQLPSPSPSPSSRSKPLYGSSEVSQGSYSSRKRNS